MNNQARVDVGQVLAAKNTMEQCNASMQNILENLSNTVAEVSHTAYVSDESKELRAVADAMKTRFAELRRDVEAFTRYLEERRTSWTATDESAGSVVNKMKNLFN